MHSIIALIVVMLVPLSALGDGVVDIIAQNTGNPNFVANVPTIVQRIAEEQSASTRLNLLIAAGSALVLKFAVDFLMHLTNPRDSVKKVLPWILAVLGVVVGVLDAYIGGASWFNAVIIGGAAPGAVLVNEMTNALRTLLQKPTPSG
jgi:F0F1-type ATP synthase membrane subunit a